MDTRGSGARGLVGLASPPALWESLDLTLGVYIPCQLDEYSPTPLGGMCEKAVDNGSTVVGSCLSYTPRVGSWSLRVRSPGEANPFLGVHVQRRINPPNGALPVPHEVSISFPPADSLVNRK